MVRGIIASNQDRYSDSILSQLEKLAAGMESNAAIPAPEAQHDGLDTYWRAQFEAHFSSATWHSAPFYAVEAFLFRRILEIVRFLDADSPYARLDPFERSKLRELVRGDVWSQLHGSLTALHSDSDSAALSLSDGLHFALTRSLWANRMDLNFKPGTSEKMAEATDSASDAALLVDDRRKVCEFLVSLRASQQSQKSQSANNSAAAPAPVTVSLVCDNSGAELLNDLLLCDFVLRHGFASALTLHVKAYPTYVSDVTLRDVDRHLSHLYVQSLSLDSQPLRELSARLTGYLKSARLRLKAHSFWNCAHCFDQLPADLAQRHLERDALVIFKGDANYRRLVLARMWSPTTPFAQVVGRYLLKTSVLSLRTMKSDCVVGIDEEVLSKVEAADAHWRHNGQRGLIQSMLRPN